MNKTITLWRVLLIDGDDPGMSLGSWWLPSEADAKQWLSNWQRDVPSGKGEIVAAKIEMTPAGLRTALNTYATHPDNG